MLWSHSKLCVCSVLPVFRVQHGWARNFRMNIAVLHRQDIWKLFLNSQSCSSRYVSQQDIMVTVFFYIENLSLNICPANVCLDHVTSGVSVLIHLHSPESPRHPRRGRSGPSDHATGQHAISGGGHRVGEGWGFCSGGSGCHNRRRVACWWEQLGTHGIQREARSHTADVPHRAGEVWTGVMFERENNNKMSCTSLSKVSVTQKKHTVVCLNNVGSSEWLLRPED